MKVPHKKIHPELKRFIPLVKVLSQTFGRKCETLIHDFSDPQHSIIAIEGNVTGRKIGDGITDFAVASGFIRIWIFPKKVNSNTGNKT